MYIFAHYIHIDSKFYKLLQHRSMIQRDPNVLNDIYDGEVYRGSSAFFTSSNHLNISFTLNYDGAPKFKSSNTQIWPVQLSNNELPPLARYYSIHICIHMHNIT